MVMQQKYSMARLHAVGCTLPFSALWTVRPLHVMQRLMCRHNKFLHGNMKLLRWEDTLIGHACCALFLLLPQAIPRFDPWQYLILFIVYRTCAAIKRHVNRTNRTSQKQLKLRGSISAETNW